jgi:hypothetical protein
MFDFAQAPKTKVAENHLLVCGGGEGRAIEHLANFLSIIQQFKY